MTPQQARALVSTIDLKAICQKVRVQQKWDAETVARAEREYREYLEAALRDPAFSAPPSRTADEIWHAHILDTAKYAADCDRVFGGMLHHVPNYEPYLKQAAAADAALCFNQRAEKSDAALCFNQRERTEGAALCFQRAEQPRDAALCFAQKGEQPRDAALCFAQKAERPQDAALCFAAKDASAEAAGCVPCFGQRDGAVATKPVTRKVRRRTRRTRV